MFWNPRGLKVLLNLYFIDIKSKLIILFLIRNVGYRNKFAMALESNANNILKATNGKQQMQHRQQAAAAAAAVVTVTTQKQKQQKQIALAVAQQCQQLLQPCVVSDWVSGFSTKKKKRNITTTTTVISTTKLLQKICNVFNDWLGNKFLVSFRYSINANDDQDNNDDDDDGDDDDVVGGAYTYNATQ